MSRTDKRSWQPYLVLALGVLAVSWAAIFIRLATAPALVTGAYRLTLASLILTPLALWRNGGELLHLDRRDLWLMAAAGVFLGLHFAAWISSLSYTSVASSVVLVTTDSLFVGLAARFLLKQYVSSSMFIGIALATLGGVIIGWGDFRVSGWALWGDVLAIIGAMMVWTAFEATPVIAGLYYANLLERCTGALYCDCVEWTVLLGLSCTFLSYVPVAGHCAPSHWTFVT